MKEEEFSKISSFIVCTADWMIVHLLMKGTLEILAGGSENNRFLFWEFFFVLEFEILLRYLNRSFNHF